MVASGLYNESCIIIANLLAFSRTVRKTRMKIKRTQTTVTYDFESSGIRLMKFFFSFLICTLQQEQ